MDRAAVSFSPAVATLGSLSGRDGATRRWRRIPPKLSLSDGGPTFVADFLPIDIVVACLHVAVPVRVHVLDGMVARHLEGRTPNARGAAAVFHKTAVGSVATNVPPE